MSQTIERALQRAESQSLLLAQKVWDTEGALPRTYEHGKLHAPDYTDWTSGFFPGTLWLLWEHSQNPALREAAERMTRRVEPAARLTDTHDLGFMLHCSAGQAYRLTGNEHYRQVLETACASLATRFMPRVGVIRSWDGFRQWQCPVIIDNMMNLEMLADMARLTGQTQWADIAVSHADKTLANHFRPDVSCYHVVSYDTITALPHAKQTHQGYADNSAWARGQGWALYGFTMMYRETGKPEYLAHAKRVAHYLRSHPRMPNDRVPYWDFDAPGQPHAPRDASAAAIMASALAELSQLDTEEGNLWLAMSQEIIRALASPAYLAEEGEQEGFVLRHSVGNWNKQSEVDVPLNYADYYFVEALLRLKRIFSLPLRT